MVKKLGRSNTTMMPKKMKDSDCPDEPLKFVVKEFGQSIVLERCESIAEAPKAGKARADWSNVNEVLAVLKANGGKMGADMLALEISSKYGLDRGMVRRAFSHREDLNWLKDGQMWRLPEGDAEEFDL